MFYRFYGIVQTCSKEFKDYMWSNVEAGERSTTNTSPVPVITCTAGVQLHCPNPFCRVCRGSGQVGKSELELLKPLMKADILLNSNSFWIDLIRRQSHFNYLYYPVLYILCCMDHPFTPTSLVQWKTCWKHLEGWTHDSKLQQPLVGIEEGCREMLVCPEWRWTRQSCKTHKIKNTKVLKVLHNEIRYNW